ncbi:hypothetical protein [Hyalangium versicolor]|uniref:hypothetical protein n=1 Tax=Hyalangium versicolor TaxID=2861190 RepID=UPI001CCAA50A|nr:hypothetical protein [Hyalangium versicolor]
MPRIPVCVVSLVLSLSGPALAGEVVYQFQTEEDPKAAANPGACQGAPFQSNVALSGIISVPERGLAEGRVELGAARHAGAALACLRITDRTFAEGSQADIYASFELPEGHFTAVGHCTAVSNAVPRAGVVLASCALKLTEFPAGYAGGSATSASVFNPLHLPGYSTGSLWTLRVFESMPAVAARAHGEAP